MFGYVVCDPKTLPAEGLERYRGVYCGLCKALGRSFGPVARLSLSYDFVFLALFAMSGEDEGHELVEGRCMLNPFKKLRYYEDNEALRLAAETSVVLTYAKLDDDVRDSKGAEQISARLKRSLFSGVWKKASGRYPEFERITAGYLDELASLDGGNGDSLDRHAHCFAKILEELFTLIAKDGDEKRILAQIGYHTGRYIYIADALDDIWDDYKTGAYNPIAACHREEGEGTEEFIARISPFIYETLIDSLTILANAYELLGEGEFKDLLDNIIYRGMSGDYMYTQGQDEGVTEYGERSV